MTTARSSAATDLTALAETIAREVGDRLVRALDGPGPVVDVKSTATDLVTDLDRWAESHITDRIVRARPDDSVEGEEGTAVSGSSDLTWCIDPIDGTVNFVHGLPGFCVSIAARDADGPLLGVVYSPLHRDLFAAHRGAGARRNDSPIRCSDPADLARSVVGTGFSYRADRRGRQAEVLTRVIGEVADIRRIGSAALDLCSVACGRLDGYWEVGLNPWDHAAGALIAKEAGAIVEIVDEGGGSAWALAAPPGIHAQLDALLSSAGARDV